MGIGIDGYWWLLLHGYWWILMDIDGYWYGWLISIGNPQCKLITVTIPKFVVYYRRSYDTNGWYKKCVDGFPGIDISYYHKS